MKNFCDNSIISARCFSGFQICLLALVLLAAPSCKEAANSVPFDVFRAVATNPPGYFFPEATAIIPSGGSIAVNTSAVITFNLPIFLPSPCASITVTSNTMGTLVEGTHYTLTLGGDNRVVIITFTGSFSPIPDNNIVTIGVVPNITAAAGGITDNPNGITVQATLSGSFTAGTAWDSTPPNIVAGTNYPTTPPATVFLTETTRMAQATPQEIHVQFNENIDPTSINTDTLYLTGLAAVPASVTYIAGTRYAILTPAVNLDPSTTYTVHVREDIRDLSGNTLGSGTADFTTWTFDTTASLAELDITPGAGPTLSGLHVDSVSTTDGSISWITDEPTFFNMHYDRNDACGTSTGLSATATTYGDETLTPLATNARYWFNLDFTDIEGLAGTNTGTYQFNTESSDGATYIDTAAGNQNSPKTIPYHPTGGGATGLYLFWNDSDVPTTYTHIYGQLYDSAFTIPALWGAARKGIFTEGGQAYTYQSAAEDGSGCVIVTAQRSTGGHIFAKRLDAGGTFSWGHAGTVTGLDIRSAPTAALSSMSAVPIAGTVQRIRTTGTMARSIPVNPVYNFTAAIDFLTTFVDGDYIMRANGTANSGTTVINSTSNYRHVIGQTAARVSPGNTYMIGDASNSVSGNADDHVDDLYIDYNTCGGNTVYTEHSFNLLGLGNGDIIQKNTSSDFGHITAAPVGVNYGFLRWCAYHAFDNSNFYDITVDWAINFSGTDTFSIYDTLATGTAETPPANPLYDNTADYLSGTAVANDDIVLNFTTSGKAAVDTSTFAIRTRALDLDSDIMSDGNQYSIIRFPLASSGTANVVTFGLVSATTTNLRDTANTFTAVVQAGDIAYNITDDQYAMVTAVAANDLTLSRNASFTAGDRYVIIRQPRMILYAWQENGNVWGRIMTADAGTVAPPLPDEIRAPWVIVAGTFPRLLSDGSGNAILIYRAASGGLWAARLNGAGTITESADLDGNGTSMPETLKDAQVDGAGGLVTLYKYANGTLHAQRVAGTSTTWATQWGATGYAFHDQTVVTDDEIIAYDSSAANDAIVTATVISGGNYDIWARRMGTTSWGPFNYTSASTARQEKPQAFLTAASCIIVWDDYRFFSQSYINTGYGIFGLKISPATGTAAAAPVPLWRANSGGTDDFGGVSVILNHCNEYPGVPLVAPYNNGADAILMWADYRAELNADLKYIDLDAFVPTP